MRLVRCKSASPSLCLCPPGSVYVGREMPGLAASPLANPFKLAKFPSAELCIRAYRRHLLELVVDGGPALLALAKLTEQSVLACWCAERPAVIGTALASKPCHGDVIATVVFHLGAQIRRSTTALIANGDGFDQVPGESLGRWRVEIVAMGRDVALREFARRCFGHAEAELLLAANPRKAEGIKACA